MFNYCPSIRVIRISLFTCLFENIQIPLKPTGTIHSRCQRTILAISHLVGKPLLHYDVSFFPDVAQGPLEPHPASLYSKTMSPPAPAVDSPPFEPRRHVRQRRHKSRRKSGSYRTVLQMPR